mmetsp:Transcript_30010/g.115199  ORF Transcript_30010/g.115199 Transcript_30010/m.115199 type:complete len:167 (-) Transcript_30010:159-659(-)
MRSDSLRLSMLSGDNMTSAERVSNEVGKLDDVHASLSPSEKLNILSGWRGSKGSVLMVGDGVNDAPALAGATVGCSLGLRSATAVENSDVIFMDENLSSLSWYIRKSKSTRAIVAQNLVLALGFMALASMSAACGALPLWLAVSMHEGGTLLVGLNGLRLLSDDLS